MALPQRASPDTLGFIAGRHLEGSSMHRSFVMVPLVRFVECVSHQSCFCETTFWLRRQCLACFVSCVCFVVMADEEWERLRWDPYWERCDECFNRIQRLSDLTGYGAPCHWCGTRLCCNSERDQYHWCGEMGKPLCELCMDRYACGGGPWEPTAQVRAARLMCRWFPLLDQTITFTIAKCLIKWHEP